MKAISCSLLAQSMLRCPVMHSEFHISNSIPLSCGSLQPDRFGWDFFTTWVKFNLLSSSAEAGGWMPLTHNKVLHACKCYWALGWSPAGGREVLSAYPWKYSTPLRWLLSYLTKLHSCCCNSSQTKTQKLLKPPINVIITHPCFSSLFHVGMQPDGVCHLRQVAGRSCLRISEIF